MSDELKPPLLARATTSTLPVLNGPADDNKEDPKSESPSRTDHDQENGLVPPDRPASSKPSVHDILLLFGIFIMLIWPWIFFGVVWARKGIQMNNHIAKVVTDNPHATTYFITLICSIIAMIVTALFSFAIIRFAQELVTRYQPTRPFYLRVLLAFRHQTWPWGKSWKDVKYLMSKTRWWPTVLVIICILTFPQLVSTTTSLITPIPFNRTSTLHGTELDFASTDPACLSWFRAHPIGDDCDWQPYKGQLYSSCLGENQMVDVLEAGRGNILELVSNNSQSLTFSQLGADDGLHFLGSIRGVLPIGPNGVPAFNTLNASPLSDPVKMAGMRSYIYTLNHQGLTSKVSCSYQPTTPIVSLASNSSDTIRYNVPSCRALGGSSILTDIPSFPSVLGKNTLMYWACQSAPNTTQAPSYNIYLAGFRGGYGLNIGNITCTVDPMQPAVFPVRYQSKSRIFSAGAVLPANQSATYSPTAFSVLTNYTLIGLGGVISQGQNFDSNLVAESIITFGVKSFGLKPYERNDEYLRLYEQMIQGIIEYQTTYVRLIYATVPDPPSSCIRTVNGSVDFEVLGWYVTSANIGFLIPLTMINGAALIALFLALTFAKVVGYLHPLHARQVVYDRDSEEEVPDEWKEKVAYQPTSILKEHFEDKVQGTLVQGGQEAATASAAQAADVVKS